EFLLVAVLAIDLDILYQCLVVVRFDGYWALADLTGIPNLFSRMGPFCRTLSRRRSANGSALPALKPCVSAVFTLYILVTVPVLVTVPFLSFCIFSILSRAPPVVASRWGPFWRLLAVFTSAPSTRCPLGMVAAAPQALLLSLPVVLVTYFPYVAGRQPARAL